ncbi:hypothetical protein F5884DRAFT_698809 [Xylogone sp. PMI_703]|nr:hypothetical protein F5884DRAFT_698809 [Xylogone sp. PMI_703]
MANQDEGLIEIVDDQTLDLILQLQLEDIGTYVSAFKEHDGEDDESDESWAFKMQMQEFQNITAFRADRSLAQSIATALYNEDQVSEAESQETSTDDGNSGQQLDDENESQNATHREVANEDANEHMNSEEAGPSQVASGRTRKQPVVLRQCEACRDEVQCYEVARAPCSHEYCYTCLQNLFQASVADESLFPPRCCQQEIQVETVRIFLKSDFVEHFHQKKIEYETPNRTYCHSSTCSAFIHPNHITGEIATCPSCSLTTCTTCKAEAHKGDCPKDAPLQQVLEIAKDKHWQRCYACWRVIELEHGCNHMTCRCGAEFCYVCGEKWKTCNCEQWTEHRLLTRSD